MAFDAVIQKITVQESSITSPGHDAVIRAYPIKEGLTENFQPGQPLAKDDNGKLLPYVQGGADGADNYIGPCNEFCDVSKRDAAYVVVHGTVANDRLLEMTPGLAEIMELKQIWPV